MGRSSVIGLDDIQDNADESGQSSWCGGESNDGKWSDQRVPEVSSRLVVEQCTSMTLWR